MDISPPSGSEFINVMRIFTPALLILLAVALFAGACSTGSSKANTINAKRESPVIDVTTAQAIVRPIPSYIEATGNLASDASTDVAPTVGGKIDDVSPPVPPVTGCRKSPK